jgi:hypothetical protein
VQTADERILPKGTAYLTDVGMTGPHDSIIGVEIQAALGRFLSEDPQPAANPYPYAGNSPVNGSDPTGEVDLFEYGAVNVNSREEAFLLVRESGQFYADQGITLLSEATEGELAFLAENQWATRRLLGTVIHRLVGQGLERAGLARSFSLGPDFLFRIAGEDVWIELTTPGQIVAHELRAAYEPLYAVAEIVTYILLL